MARDLILHIGTTKTGSTSIQYALASLRPALAAAGVYYPTSPGEVAHHILPAAFVPEETLSHFRAAGWNGLPPKNRLDLFRAEFAAEMQAIPAGLHRCVLSSELISARLHETAQVQAMADFLRPYFDRIQVVVYIRRQDQHVASDYNQVLRNGHMQEPGLLRADGKPDPRLRALDYQAMLARFAAVFGEDALVPRIFAREALQQGDVIDDFLTVTGIDITVPEASRDRQRNVGMSIEGQMLMLAAMRHKAQASGGGTFDKSWRRLAEAVTRTLPGRGWRPTRDEARAFMDHFVTSNDAVRRRYFPARASLFSTGFDDLPETDQPPGEGALLDGAIAVLLAEMTERMERELSHRQAQYRLNKRLNDADGMRAALARVIELAPDDAAPRLRMAELCLEDGKPHLAREHAEAALRLKPGWKLAQDVRQRAGGAPAGRPAGEALQQRGAADRRGPGARQPRVDPV